MVVDDEVPQGLADDPHAAVRGELVEAVTEEEFVEGGLPDAVGVAAAGHVPFDPEEHAAGPALVGVVGLVGDARLAADESDQPAGHHAIDGPAALC